MSYVSIKGRCLHGDTCTKECAYCTSFTEAHPNFKSAPVKLVPSNYKEEKHLSWDTKAHKRHKDILNEIYSANKYYMTEQAKDAMLDAIECLDLLGEENE